jgi:hypothetical protein
MVLVSMVRAPVNRRAGCLARTGIAVIAEAAAQVDALADIMAVAAIGLQAQAV